MAKTGIFVGLGPRWCHDELNRTESAARPSVSEPCQFLLLWLSALTCENEDLVMRSVSIIFFSRIPALFFAGSLVLLGGGCDAHQANRTSANLIPSSCALVVPSGEMRMVQAMAGLPEPGAEYGPFSGRNDSRMGVRQAPLERIEDGYERVVFDRQFTSVGRPYNIYQDTTYAVKRISR
jgi:hypothetical protein